MGYRVECKDTLYCVPTPLVKIDERNRFHSTEVPAIRWKDGKEFYYIHNINFDKELWSKVVSGKMPVEDIFAIENTEQRRAAYEIMDKTRMKELKDYKVLDKAKDDCSNPMKIISFKVKQFDEPLKYLNCFCPRTKREYFIETRKDKCWDAKNRSFGFEEEISWIKEY